METPDGNRPRLTPLGDRHLGAARRQARRQRVRVAGRPESLSVVLQPVVALYTEVPIGFEALARFRCAPGRGPAWWFAEAEAVGLRTDLELAAVRAALRTLDHLPEGTWLAVNASPSTMTSPGFADVISASTPPADAPITMMSWPGIGAPGFTWSYIYQCATGEPRNKREY